MTARGSSVYVGVAVCLAMLLISAVWIIRTEGERTRAAIQDAANQAASLSPIRMADNAEQVIEKAGETATDVLREADRVLRSPADETAGEASPPVKQRKEPILPASDKPPADRLADLFDVLFDTGEKATRAADAIGQHVLRLNPQEEIRLGREMHAEICRQYKVLRPRSLLQRLEKLAQPHLDRRTRKNLTFRFTILNSDELNAFAHVGGYVYVNRKAIEVFKADEELQFVVGHEIAHIELGHVSERITYAARAAEMAGPMAGVATQLAYLSVAIGYSPEQEFEADLWSYREMLRTGHSPEAALAALRRMAGYLREAGVNKPPPAPRNPAERVLFRIDDHFRSHPPVKKRIERLESSL